MYRLPNQLSRTQWIAVDSGSLHRKWKFCCPSFPVYNNLSLLFIWKSGLPEFLFLVVTICLFFMGYLTLNYICPSIFLIAFPIQGHMGTGAYPSCQEQEAEYILDRSPVNINGQNMEADNHSRDIHTYRQNPQLTYYAFLLTVGGKRQ